MPAARSQLDRQQNAMSGANLPGLLSRSDAIVGWWGTQPTGDCPLSKCCHEVVGLSGARIGPQAVDCQWAE